MYSDAFTVYNEDKEKRIGWILLMRLSWKSKKSMITPTISGTTRIHPDCLPERSTNPRLKSKA